MYEDGALSKWGYSTLYTMQYADPRLPVSEFV